MKITKPSYEWTGEHRPPRDGELFFDPVFRCVARAAGDYPTSTAYDIYREVMREHEVPDPVPEWIVGLMPAVCGDHAATGVRARGCHFCDERAQKIAAAYRAHVAERAKAAADRLDDRMVGTMVPTERIIREVFLA